MPEIVLTQEIAAEVLQKIEEDVISAKEALKKRFLEEKVDYKIRGSVHAYVMETLKRRNAIDFLINLCLENKKVEDLKPFIRNLLRIGIYEMLYKGVPPPLATDSAVRIARRRFGRGAAALVNAVMRKAEKINLKEEIEKIRKKDRIGYLALKYFHPDWFVKYTIDLLGEKQAIELMIADVENQPVYVRVNELKTSIESVRRYLEDNDVIIQETPLPEVFRVLSYVKPPAALEWHNKGYYVIQDLASAFVSHVLNPEPGEVILDLAAAPGSKTSHIAMLMENKGKIIAVDNSAERLERMKNKMKILGVKNVEYVLADGARFSVGEVDRVLIDPPCSSTGTLRTHPCVKWRYDPVKYKATIKIQRKMLKNAFRNLKDDGMAVYSTCSLTFEENEENILYASEFFRVENIDARIGTRGITEFRGKKFPFWDKVIRTYPHMHNCSGFFISKLSKQKSDRNSF